MAIVKRLGPSTQVLRQTQIWRVDPKGVGNPLAGEHDTLGPAMDIGGRKRAGAHSHRR